MPDTRIVHVTYSGVLTGDANVAVYDWLDELYQDVDITSMYGQVFDFRKVEEFAQDNLKTARRVSNRMNMKIDTSQIPVALLVGDPYHQEILLGSMRISPEHRRKKIVWSEDEALEFFEQWHTEREQG
jgi:hypothetical protein